MNHTSPQFYFDAEDGSSMCIISTKNKTYVGTAKCSEQDHDMQSEKTGCEIAYRRAYINFLKGQRDELKIELQGLKRYYYSICQSKQYDKTSYASKMLLKQIKNKQEIINDLKEMILDEKTDLIEWMNKKAEFYQTIRKNRQVKNN